MFRQGPFLPANLIFSQMRNVRGMADILNIERSEIEYFKNKF